VRFRDRDGGASHHSCSAPRKFLDAQDSDLLGVAPGRKGSTRSNLDGGHDHAEKKRRREYLGLKENPSANVVRGTPKYENSYNDRTRRVTKKMEGGTL